MVKASWNRGGRVCHYPIPWATCAARIHQQQRSRHTVCLAPASKLQANVLDVLRREGYASAASRPSCAPA